MQEFDIGKDEQLVSRASGCNQVYNEFVRQV